MTGVETSFAAIAAALANSSGNRRWSSDGNRR
jgi:hypothetical protein